ncbi:MAG: peptidylprolyl isomerase [Anderseniella sp.]|jgi:parvulin-like peptidyl-prolyl isomerase|nr:peptidylprolyl isomerase [Anderseniella sp.]
MRLACEPLLHFLIAGGLLFAAYGWLNRESADAPRTVRISVAEVNWLKETWARQWQRPPTENELRGLVTDYLKETLLAREATEMGLDENDTVIRRRLAQKMEFLAQDTARLAEPGDAELRRFYDANRAHYQAPARVSFTQLFFRNEADAKRGLAQLATRSPDDLGDPSMLERDHAEADAQAVTNQFGEAFSRQVFGLDTGPWHGPVASAYGFHLVRVSARQDARLLPYEAVRTQVLEDWQREEQTRASERFYAELLKKYDVVLDDSVKSLVGPLAEMAR